MRHTTNVVLVASQKAPVRSRWRQGLQNKFAISEVSQWAMLKDGLVDLKPAVVLLDISLPGRGGLSRIASIIRLAPRSKIILLTRTPHDREGLSAIRLGARGYCSESLATPLMRRIIEKVSSGEVWIGRRLVAAILEEVASLSAARENASSNPGPPGLTFRERDIARLVGQGATNKEIAIELNLSEKTVKGHMTAMFRKLGVANRLRLALVLAQFGGLSRHGFPGGEARPQSRLRQYLALP